ncbi:methylated-DNA--[protein]-cysteine S-methyltransferase [Reyranella sp.]|uniref:methylated-DNA--[protein]-cysteine S-methyltransferase n=1 Tax=Reyranella sp. TaxID=1929291 RepID=UPI0025D3171D|nr:methylated-DNA--[protein]-cysteine S-methyltransferase [Reyranella sp.]
MATTVRYAKAESSLGTFVAAMSDKGLVMVEFGDMNEALRAKLAARFPEATLVEDNVGLHDSLDRLARLIDHPDSGEDFALDLQGSAFELSVWEALRQIPAGQTANYGEIATKLGVPRQAREVGEACAANMLAVVVPCHRVVKKDGSISGYRWGVRRKRALIEREARAQSLPGLFGNPHGAAST